MSRERNFRNENTQEDIKKKRKFTTSTQTKLVVLFFIVLLAFVGLSARLIIINRDKGESYKKQVLSQQQYDSRTLPYKRGDILDAKGTVLATSEKVYNVILDTKLLRGEEKKIDATLDALEEEFELDQNAIEDYMEENPTSQYYVLKKRLTYDEISGFVEKQNEENSTISANGVWFEEEYKRVYPYNTLACDVIGFTGTDNVGTYGLEEYYSSTLNGTNGREYGYLNTEATLERTTIAAVDGNTIQTTIYANIQSIVEKYLLAFNEEHKDEARDGEGSNNTACIIMDVNTGEVLAMASYPNYDLNNPYDLSTYYTEEEITLMQADDTYTERLNALWKNFCITETYEPGSVSKLFTVGAGLDTGTITGNETYYCDGVLHVGGYDIHCHNRSGDGTLTVAGAVAQSCNVALMYMGAQVGAENFVKYQEIFNFGLKTNIDLAGEARTASLIHGVDTMGETELATSSFGQGFNVTMIQEIAAFSSLINGGNYYEPHMVDKIIAADGSTVENIEPRMLKQTVSTTTSEQLIEYCNLVVSEGTGKTARPAGYAIGGKTGTAQTLPRGNGEFVLSFMGYAPANNPQIAIYVVVDRPNAAKQDQVSFATGIVRNILTEVLPYMNIYMTEELSEDEQKELEERQLAITLQYASDEDDISMDDGDGENQPWKKFPIDPETGYAVNPNTGELVDPETGDAMDSEGLTLPDPSIDLDEPE